MLPKNIGILIAALMISVLLVSCGNALNTPAAVAPTVTPVIVDSEPCQGKIQASEPVVVRPEGIGGVDNAEYGYFVTDTKAASTSAGILVVWRTGFEGQSPMPNSFVRLLDNNGKPTGDVRLLQQRTVAQTPHLVNKADNVLFTFCGLYDDGTYITSALLDPNGKFISEQRRPSAEVSQCGADMGPATLWTGSRLLFAWSSSYYAPNGFSNNVVFDIADPNGMSLIAKKIRTDGMLDPHFALGHGRVLLVVPIRTDFDYASGSNPGVTHLAVHRFDLEGNEIGDPLILDQLGNWEFGNSFVVPTQDGWLLLASTFRTSPNYYFAHLAPDGSLISGPELMHTGQEISFLDAVPYAGGAAVLVDHQRGFSFSKVYFLSADGFVRQEWVAGPSEYMGLGNLVVHRGHLYATYTTAPTQGKPVTNQVLMREFQCVP